MRTTGRHVETGMVTYLFSLRDERTGRLEPVIEVRRPAEGGPDIVQVNSHGLLWIDFAQRLIICLGDETAARLVAQKDGRELPVSVVAHLTMQEVLREFAGADEYEDDKQSVDEV